MMSKEKPKVMLLMESSSVEETLDINISQDDFVTFKGQKNSNVNHAFRTISKKSYHTASNVQRRK